MMKAEQPKSPVAAIDISGLEVVYKTGMKSTVAVKGLTLKVNIGEVFGFLGPNGAGKSTTLKALLGFVFPTKGTAKLLGHDAGSIEARRRIGYLPEVAVYYPYLKAREFLWMYGRVQGIDASDLKQQIPRLLDKVGLAGKEDSLLKHFSKGMLQRIGLAQALLGDPELFIFDEPASGLDPLGRRDLRQVITELKDRGKTIFFSSHELSEVELICHRFAILKKGKVIRQGTTADVMKADKPSLEDYFVDIISEGEGR